MVSMKRKASARTARNSASKKRQANDIRGFFGHAHFDHEQAEEPPVLSEIAINIPKLPLHELRQCADYACGQKHDADPFPSNTSTSSNDCPMSLNTIALPVKGSTSKKVSAPEERSLPQRKSSPRSSRRSSGRRTTLKLDWAAIFEDDDEVEPRANRSAAQKARPQEVDVMSAFDPDQENSDDASDGLEWDDGASYDDEPTASAASDTDEPEYGSRAEKKRFHTAAAASSKGKHKPNSQAAPSKRPSRKRMSNLTSGMLRALDTSLPPISTVPAAFRDMTQVALPHGLEKAATRLSGRQISVATFCSGTESPLLALQLIQDSLRSDHDLALDVKHLFSAEIVPYKQAYIERNFDVPIIFRDITELLGVDDTAATATTAYGAKAAIPRDIDLIIAGTACVDYSSLNNKKKGIDDGGESGDTFKAVLKYASLWRPRMLILENTMGAPWDDHLSRYEAIGYDVAGVLVDTKNYYLPQTRQRGYMFCVDRQLYSNDLKAGSKITETWTKTMTMLRRSASSPASAFMLSNDDPVVLIQQAVMARRKLLDGSIKDTDWSACILRHIRYRLEEKIGNARPFTSWQESGTLQVPDYADLSWFKEMPERVWDLVDCSLLRKAAPEEACLDIQYKNRIINVSQNLDRDKDTTPAGIAPCITPAGIFFATDRGGAITSHECLTLQGLPLDKISFTTETPRQILDMAGNAMSSTVVGAAIIAALISAADLNIGKLASLDQGTPRERNDLTELPCTDSSHSVSTTAEMYCREMTFDALASAQKCRCEGTFDLARKPIQTCTDCGHTSCVSCGGKPLHNYARKQTLRAERLGPGTFQQRWAPKLPAFLHFDHREQIVEQIRSRCPKAASYLRSVDVALTHHLKFRGLRRGASWTALWTSEYARLEMLIEESQMRWMLYALPDAGLAVNDPLRQLLATPIGIADVKHTSSDLSPTVWAWAVPTSKTSEWSVRPSVGTLPSWRARLRLPGKEQETMPKYIDITGKDDSSHISGRYSYLPQCGTAAECLFKREDSTEPRFLLLRSDPVGDAADDRMVIVDGIASAQRLNRCRIFGEFPKGWRPWKIDSAKAVAVKTPKDWICTDRPSTLMLDTIDVEFRALDAPSAALDRDISCDHIFSLVHIRTNSDRVASNSSLKDLRWLFTAIQPSLPRVQDQPLNLVSSQTACGLCSPTYPPLRWVWSRDGRSLRPYEDPAAATAYEKSLKLRPETVKLTLRVEKGNTYLSLQGNVLSLAHRAISKLRRLAPSPSTGKVQLSWTRDSCYVESSSLGLPSFTLQTNGEDVGSETNETGSLIELWDMQRRSLSWMLRQEQGIIYDLEEAEEVHVPEIDWRIEVRARQKHTVRGGIQASHPGFGKTICTLALIGHDYQTPQTSSGRHYDRALEHTGSLVIVPKTLVGQWKDEVAKVLGPEFVRLTITLERAADLLKHDIANFRKARIVICNQDILTSESYVKRLATFAGFPEPSSTKGRQYQTWLRLANRAVHEHARMLQESGLSALNKHVKSVFATRMSDPDFTASIPSKRLKGSAYANKHDSGVDSNQVQGRHKLDQKLLAMNGAPLLEMFRFNRLVVDEFTYLTAHDYAAVANLNADKRWALSATAPLQDPYDVSRIAALIGVKLRMSEGAVGALTPRNQKKILEERTESEQFQTYRCTSSMAMTKRTFELSQRFLDQFVRQNILTFGEFPFQDHLMPVVLRPTHRLIYTELSQHLNSADMRLKMTKKTNRDRESQIYDMVTGAESAEEALARLSVRIDATRYGADTAEVPLDVVAQKRSSQAASIHKSLAEAIAATVAAVGAKDDPEYDSWKSDIAESGSLGDDQTTAELRTIFESIGTTSRKKDSKVSTRDLLSKANDLAKQLLAANRSVRFVNNAQVAVVGGKEALRCQGADCPRTGCNSLFISSLCGHAMCQDCSDLLQSGTGSCKADGCRASIARYNLLSVHKLLEHSRHRAGFCGTKIEAVTEQLRQIKRQGDQAIVFVQHEQEIAMIEDACEKSSIRCTAIYRNTPSDMITKFQQDRRVESRSTTIILNASNASAAGINLEVANHVLFLSPLLMDSQYNYDAAMAQAIGRVRRPGQKKKVHVYRFLALDTIDVDILEHRERRSDPISELGAEPWVGPMTSDTSGAEGAAGAGPERTQLIRDAEGVFRLVPKSWLVNHDENSGKVAIEGRARVSGYEDFSSLIKFSKAYSEDD